MSEQEQLLFEYLLRLGDDRLIHGHRLSEWCGHAPILEEDIALGNIALDCIGHASMLLTLSAGIENNGRTEDDLVYFREAVDYRNLNIAGLPNKDFAFTIAKMFLIDCYSFFLYEELQGSSYTELNAIARKAFKEINYHLRHSSQWVLRLGDGTEESHYRIQNAINDIWIYTEQFFVKDDIDEQIMRLQIGPDLEKLKDKWNDKITSIFKEATLNIPDVNTKPHQKRRGQHTEYLGRLLSEMQITARSFPGVKW